MAISINGATGPYTSNDGPGWYGRNAQNNSRDTLRSNEQGLLTQLLKRDPVEATGDVYDQFQTKLRYAPEDSKDEALAENALGYAAEDLTDKGKTKEERTETTLQRYGETMKALIAGAGSHEAYQAIEPAINDLLAKAAENHVALLDRNGNGELDPEEAAAEVLLQDDPVHAIEATGLNETEAGNVDIISGKTVADFLKAEDSKRDGEITPQERIMAGVLGSQAEVSTGKALDKIIADFDLKERAGAFAGAAETTAEEENTAG